MKNTSFKLKIETPCHENWQKMNTNKDGKFCDACQKNVVDFTNKTPREIALALNNSSEKMCGRFTATQLEQVYSVVAPQRIETNWYKNIAASFLVMLGVKSVSAQDTIPKTQSNFVEGNSSMIIGDTILVEQTVEQKELLIRGILIDVATGEPIYGLKVFIENKTIGVRSDFDGLFELRFNSNQIGDSTQLDVFGFEIDTITTIIKKNDFNKDGILNLEFKVNTIRQEDLEMIGMIVVDKKSKKRNRTRKKKN